MALRWTDWPPRCWRRCAAARSFRRIRWRSTPTASSIVRRQRALTRYYLDAGAGGLAVGVHTTQFAIREAGLYRPVLELAMRTAAEWAQTAAGDDRGACRPHRAGGRAKRRSRATSAITPGFCRSPP